MSARTIRNLQIEYAGQQYSGSYETRDGMVEVSSAYGSKSTPATGKGPGVIAADLLRQIAESYRGR